jgi:hypothetical protein
MAGTLAGLSGPYDDHDAYLVVQDPSRNIKLRRKTGTLKLKRMVDRTADGFELWTTVLDCRLPASRQAWETALSWVGVEADPLPLVACRTPDEAIAALTRAAPGFVSVETVKHRLFYRESGDTRMESARVDIAGTPFATVVFESNELARARALRNRFGVALERPENYVALIAAIVPR